MNAVGADARSASAEPPGAVAGERLELDRRLGLIVDLVADVEQRGDRVEQPPHARRRDDAGTGLHLTQHDTTARSRRSPAPVATTRPAPMPAAARYAIATRQGAAQRRRRPAAAAPRDGPRGRSRRSRRPAPRRPRSPDRRRAPFRNRCRRTTIADDRLCAVEAVLGHQRRRRGRGGAGPPRRAPVRGARAPNGATGRPGCGSSATISGVDRDTSTTKAATLSLKSLLASRGSRGRRCAGSSRREPAGSPGRTCSSARRRPRASARRSRGSVTGSGAYPRERRTGCSRRRRRGPPSRRTATWMPRSCTSKASARSPRRSTASPSSVQIGSLERLPGRRDDHARRLRVRRRGPG